MSKINFKIYNLNILQESKLAWENDQIKNPRLSIKGIGSDEMTIDEVEDFLISNIKRYFKDIKDIIPINQFNEAKLIMPAFQMCSDDKLDVVDFGFNIINPSEQNLSEPLDEFTDDETGSEWNHPSEMWEEFAEMIEKDLEEGIENLDIDNIPNDESIQDKDDDTSQSEIDFIKRSIEGNI